MENQIYVFLRIGKLMELSVVLQFVCDESKLEAQTEHVKFVLLFVHIMQHSNLKFVLENNNYVRPYGRSVLVRTC